MLDQESVHGLRGPSRLLDLLGDRDQLRESGERALRDPFEVVPQTRLTLRAPIPVPPSVRDFIAFEGHLANAVEPLGLTIPPEWYEIPAFYFTNPAAIHGPMDEVAISPGSTQFDYELEVAAVIGKPGSDIRVEDAAEHIAGYTIMCDWSARDLQMHEMAVKLGPAKGKDSATTLGPALVTADELEVHRGPTGLQLAMTASVNGVQYSSGNLGDMHWSFEQMIAYASRGTRLVTGDVIGSGTVPTGCILELSRLHGAERFPWLKAGDEVRLEVEQLGCLSVRITESRQAEELSRA
ncbi:fumarylacetoacetate hydrolase family protein [Streptomyces vinaceus]|uniref:fumarylacetoacetate hydrolase family protein n=1 Tax=Streptomyces vinaceus TaxID=1960 RepID=UPI0035E1E693